MKILLILTSAAALAMVSCSVDSHVNLSKTAMSFNQQGAGFGECGLVSQFERGRSTSSQSAGGG